MNSEEHQRPFHKESKWLTVQEVARYMRVCERTVRSLIGSGKLKSKKRGTRPTGGKILIHRNWVDRFIIGGGNHLTTNQKTELKELHNEQ
jgi:excisionase family DNA binding protein